MKRKSAPPGDEFEIRCPRLGHPICFSYCRSENRGLPCFKALDCWFEHFQVEAFFQGELTPEEWERIFSGPPKPKMLSLVELIEEAKKSAEPGSVQSEESGDIRGRPPTGQEGE